MRFGKLFFYFLFVPLVAFADRPVAETASIPSGVSKAEKLWSGLDQKNSVEWVRAIQPDIRTGFTLSFDSKSFQGKERAILFGKDGETIYSVSPVDGRIEIVADQDGKTIPHLMTSNGSKAHITSPQKACAKCHGPNFTYIFPEYLNVPTPQWPGFLGEIDDQVDPSSTVFRNLRSRPNFAPLFAHASRESFPYWRPANEQELSAGKKPEFERDLLENMPNSRLAIILAQRAARRLAINLQTRRPERYAKYKFLVMKIMMDCLTPVELGAYEELLQDFRRDVPERAKKWEEVLAVSVSYEKQVQRSLMVLDYLGVAPTDIILQKALDREVPDLLEKPYFLKAFANSFNSRSPLNYSASGAYLREFVPSYLRNDIHLPEFWDTAHSASEYDSQIPYVLSPPVRFIGEDESIKGCEILEKASRESLSAVRLRSETRKQTPQAAH